MDHASWQRRLSFVGKTTNASSSLAKHGEISKPRFTIVADLIYSEQHKSEGKMRRIALAIDFYGISGVGQ